MKSKSTISKIVALFVICIFSSQFYAQCVVQSTSTNPTTSYAAGVGQTFVASCTEKLKSLIVSFIPGNAVSNDVLIKLMDANKNVLATLTNQHMQSGDNTYDFSSFNITLTQGNTYIFDLYRNPTNSGQISTWISRNEYADGYLYLYDTQGNYTYFTNQFDALFKLGIGTSVLGTNDVENKQSLKVFPNPFTEILNISSEENGIVQFYDTLGKLVATEKLTKGNNSFNKSSLNPGIYIYQIKNTNGEMVSSGKVFKK